MPNEKESMVPTWSGDPAEFEHFVIACKWYEKSLKEPERSQAASRVWSRLSGPAKQVVRHLDPDAYESDDGLRKLLHVLRESPLQQLPIPDSFSRLERWHSLRRMDTESIAELLIREQDLFTQLQQALHRARSERQSPSDVFGATAQPEAPEAQSTEERVPSQTESSSRAARPSASTPTASTPPATTRDFFEDELRGYRLLRAANLGRQERQNILTQTNNSTEFFKIRRALRTVFAEEQDPQRKKAFPLRALQ